MLSTQSSEQERTWIMHFFFKYNSFIIHNWSKVDFVGKVHPVSDFYHIIRLIFAFILKKKICHVRKKLCCKCMEIKDSIFEFYDRVLMFSSNKQQKSILSPKYKNYYSENDILFVWSPKLCIMVIQIKMLHIYYLFSNDQQHWWSRNG